MPRRVVHRWGAVTAVALMLTTSGCATGTHDAARSTATTTPRILPIDFSRPGPYEVGMIEVNITPTTTTTTSVNGSASTISTSTTGVPAEASGSTSAATSSSPTPANGATATRRAAVFYPADAGSPGRYERLDHYTTAEAFPEQVRSNLPSEIIHTVSVDLLKRPPANPEGPFPVVIHSHDVGGHYLFESVHFRHLASWGFVVAAPDHQERSLAAQLVPRGEEAPPYADQDVTDMRNTLQALRTQNLVASGPLQGALDLDHVAAEGHGAGGRAAALFARDPAVKAFIGLAPAPALPAEDLPLAMAPEEQLETVTSKLEGQSPPDKPSMLIASDQDDAIPLPIVRAQHDWLGKRTAAPAIPHTTAVLDNAGHHAYTDLCIPIRQRGGLSQYTEQIPELVDFFRLGENGCLPENLPPEQGYRLVNQLTVAHLRWVFGTDDRRTSLDPVFLEQTFGDALESIEHS